MFLQYFNAGGSYTLCPVKPEDLEGFFSSLNRSNYTGLNVTVPYKIRAVGFCTSLSSEAEVSGAVNTLVLEENGIKGCNTDVAGFRKLCEELPSPFFVFGTGGAAAAVSCALEGREVSFISRGGSISIPRERLPAAATVVNATPLGWNDDDLFPFDVPEGWYFADLNYNPLWKWRNHLISPVVTGETMLVEQAAESFRLWTGYNPDEELRAKVLERIREKLHGR
jgi:shikimate dehydrogenase